MTSAALAASSTLLAEVPEVTGVTMAQDASRLVPINYNLANAPAVVTAVVTAWVLDNTSDYMVVDITAAAKKGTQEYYPRAEYLPGLRLAHQSARRFVHRASCRLHRRASIARLGWRGHQKRQIMV